MARVRIKVGRRAAVAAIMAGLLSVQTAFGQEPTRGTLLTNALRQTWVQLGMVSGRVLLKSNRGIQTSTSSHSGQRRERLSLRAAGTDPVLDYDLATPAEEITVRFSAANRLDIRRVPKVESDAALVEFHQPAAGPVSLKVGKSDPQTYQAASLWHLFVQEPAVCRQRLMPLLNLLHSDWDLAKTGDEVEGLLLRMAGAGTLPDQSRWAELVRQLGDGRFAAREAADRRLREAGRSVVPYLQKLDPARLDAEQQLRIRRIVQALTTSSGDDAPEQLASWLSGDPAIWLAMLSRPEESTRRLAVRQLGALLGGPITFDPAADPQTRKKQIDDLRGRILPK